MKTAIDTSKEQVVKTEHKAENKLWFDCDKCEGKFKFANDLEKHMTNPVEDSNTSKFELSTSPGNRTQKKIREDISFNPKQLG